MKAMKWSKNHTDIYAFDDGVWVKVQCNVSANMDCTAPNILPRGTKFSYNVKATLDLEYREELALARRHRK